MDMALKSDVASACRDEGSEKPVDLVYLSSLTMGDRNLEKEILSMFCAQLDQYLEALAKSDERSDLNKAAHTLKGAARSIGAFRLADLASAVEAGASLNMSEVEAEADQVPTYIENLAA